MRGSLRTNPQARREEIPLYRVLTERVALLATVRVRSLFDRVQGSRGNLLDCQPLGSLSRHLYAKLGLILPPLHPKNSLGMVSSVKRGVGTERGPTAVEKNE